MQRYRILLWLGLFGLASVSTSIGAPLEAYGRLPTLDNLTISPDGKELAYVTGFQGDTTVVVYGIDSAKVVAGINLGTIKVRDVSWADNDNILITASTTALAPELFGFKGERSVAQIFTVSSKTLHPLLIGARMSLNVIYSRPVSRIINGRTIVFVEAEHSVLTHGRLSLFAIDIGDADFALNRIKILEDGTGLAEGWTVDGSGNAVASEEYSEGDKHWVLNVMVKDHWAKTFDLVAPIDIPEIQGLSADGHSLIVRLIDGGKRVVEEVSLADGSVTKLSDPVAALEYPFVDDRTGRVIGHVTIDSGIHYTFFDKTDQEAWNSVAQAFSGETVHLVSWSMDRKRGVVRVDGTSSGCEYELIDLNTGLAKPIGAAFEGIGRTDVSDVKYVTYPAADGMKIPAYLTLPRGRAAKDLPLIVLAHGGPTAQDEPGFDWWAQAFASRGYAVLQPQFRGSAGLGWEHLAAGFGQWGRKMQTDLSDGVRYLAAQGVIDPKRVCIVGGSYGGYAALAGATLDRGVYRCAVSVAGVSDPHGLLSWQRDRQLWGDSIALRFWSRFMGVEGYDDPKLSEISPLAHAPQADIPILLIHGTNDTIVPIGQSEDMDSALRAAGKPVTFTKLDSEDHWLSRSETREQMLAASVAFLDKNNPAN